MELKDRLRQSIQKRHDRVILRSELTHLGAPTQLSRALHELQQDGLLERASKGVFINRAAAHQALEHSQDALAKLARELYEKAGAQVSDVLTSNASIAVILSSHVAARRQFAVQGTKIHAHYFSKLTRPRIPKDVSALPKVGVDRYVQRLALAFQVHYRRSALDVWAEAITHAAGDRITSDATNGLLVQLKQMNAINARQFAQLVVNHRREAARV